MRCKPTDLPAALLGVASRRELVDGDIVFRQGARAQAVFYLCAGSVRLGRHGRAGEEVSIHHACAGEFFAEASLYGDRYHCTAVATQPGHLFVLPAAALKGLLACDLAFSQQWIALLSAQLRRTRIKVERLCLKSAQERIRHLLLTEGTGPSSRYRLRGTFKDLAAELGITHEALYRTMAVMVRSGVIARNGQSLSIT
jgi:CRP/FNR family transcriptional regulator, dissimilatory nitrate respiration regulator